MKERYDSVTKMYKLLMTNEQLEAQCGAVDPPSVSDLLIFVAKPVLLISIAKPDLLTFCLQKSLSTRQQSLVTANSDDYCAVTSEDCPDFCAKFGVDEQPLAGWHSGRRCTLMDREKPLIGSKGGTLYLTHR